MLERKGNVGGVDVQHVSKTFEGNRGRASVQVIENISLNVRAGEFVAIVGPSGCGKSTLLSIIAGYMPVDMGKVLIDGKPVTGPGSDRVMVFQRPTLFPWLSAAQNIAFGLRLAANRETSGLNGNANEATIQLLDLVGLRTFHDHYPFELSGGMQQRVEIARALAVNPRVLLMDEPFGALDALTRRSMQDELAKIHSKTACTTIFITHDVYEAIALADRIVVMSQRPCQIKETLRISLDRNERRDSVEAVSLARRMSILLGEAPEEKP